MSVNLNRAAHTAYFSNLRGTLDAPLNVVLVPIPSWGRGLVGWLLWAPPPSVICSQLTFSEISIFAQLSAVEIDDTVGSQLRIRDSTTTETKVGTSHRVRNNRAVD